MGDIPVEEAPHMDKLFVALDPRHSDEQLISIIDEWRTDVPKRLAFVKRAMQYCQLYYGGLRAMSKIVDAFAAHKRGDRGSMRSEVADSSESCRCYSNGYYDFQSWNDQCPKGNDTESSDGNVTRTSPWGSRYGVL
jgi:hypothetical protein